MNDHVMICFSKVYGHLAIEFQVSSPKYGLYLYIDVADGMITSSQSVIELGLNINFANVIFGAIAC